MSKRTLRRSAERAARKAARTLPPPAAETPKTLAATASQRIFPKTYDPNYVFQDDPDPADNPPPPPPETDRAATNRANAQKSTGPSTPEGKSTSSLNALKHGLTGNTILLASDDAEAYQHRLDEYVAQYKPVTLEERRLVQSIHDAAWRLDRIVNLESTIYAKGLMELQFCFYELPEEQRKSFIDLEITERNAKQLRNFHLHEARLQRQRAKDIAALKELIAERLAAEKAAADSSPIHPNHGKAGFVFTNVPVSPSEPNNPAPNLGEETPQGEEIS